MLQNGQVLGFRSNANGWYNGRRQHTSTVSEQFILSFKVSEQFILSFKVSKQFILSFKVSEQFILSFKVSEQFILSFKVSKQCILSFKVSEELFILSFKVSNQFILIFNRLISDSITPSVNLMAVAYFCDESAVISEQLSFLIFCS